MSLILNLISIYCNCIIIQFSFHCFFFHFFIQWTMLNSLSRLIIIVLDIKFKIRFTIGINYFINFPSQLTINVLFLLTLQFKIFKRQIPRNLIRFTTGITYFINFYKTFNLVIYIFIYNFLIILQYYINYYSFCFLFYMLLLIKLLYFIKI